ncbi:hypothetical protein FA954_04795 [Thermoactinomyces vulgaris]|jgi:aromatic ring hydroxylase|nr:4-hydroxyphenylacetate 3-hydroxylase C-terminal domain-containing protein [Thermoactinomyces sp. CICC 10735]QCV54981.1 hypothetical protein FA954_04795 [Thermoactinomyces vulgaris]
MKVLFSRQPLGEANIITGRKIDADSRIWLFKSAWDLIGSPLGSRQELYERFHRGSRADV